ncbi:mucin-binding protein [Xylocopilactobacillus apicola]|uniref:Mub B2-like domain-containing protein n=1 Tax=Xylocopilactobacillus apicola TaxID=2932184 RepID=A0AAU9D7Q1_9LACO|nr:BspA family leucine-rich repeat surface protein [Xylocopilactobacillus apicola]BDR59578.1 hypothetical protein XA3_20190 [Xylocopilactobacillus apicola]
MKNKLKTAIAVLGMAMGIAITAQPVLADSSPNEVSAQSSSKLTRGEGTIVKSGTWGTSNWDYIENGNEKILQFHAGTLGTGGIFSIGTPDYTGITRVQFDQGVVPNPDSSILFSYLTNLQQIEGLTNFDTSNVTNMSGMFQLCCSLQSLDLSNFDTSNVKYMGLMFSMCQSLASLDLSNFDTKKVSYQDRIFYNTTNLKHLVLSPKAVFNYILPDIPAKGTVLPDRKIVDSPNWVATSGYQKGSKYSPSQLLRITDRDQITTYDWDIRSLYDIASETKSVTRTINVQQLDDSVKTYTQTATISRKNKVNGDGTQIYGEWSKAHWDKFDVPVIHGYEANETSVPLQGINGETADQTIDIYYTPIEESVTINYVDADGTIVGTKVISGEFGDVLSIRYRAPKGYEIVDDLESFATSITVDGSGDKVINVNVDHKTMQSSESRTVVRTVNIHRPNGTMKSYPQTVVISRKVIIDQVTHAKTYGSWSTGTFDEIIVPTIAGYTPNQTVDAETVTSETQNKVIDVYYIKN